VDVMNELKNILCVCGCVGGGVCVVGGVWGGGGGGGGGRI